MFSTVLRLKRGKYSLHLAPGRVVDHFAGSQVALLMLASPRRASLRPYGPLEVHEAMNDRMEEQDRVSERPRTPFCSAFRCVSVLFGQVGGPLRGPAGLRWVLKWVGTTRSC